MGQRSREGTAFRRREIGTGLLFLGLLLLLLAASTGSLPPANVPPAPSPTPDPTLPVPSATPPSTATAPSTWTLATPQPTPLPASPPTRLVLPALDLDAAVVEVPVSNGTWDLAPLTQEIAHLGETAYPGEGSNMVLAGHVTLSRGAGPFLLLERLQPGDAAIVYAGEQAYTYRVVSKTYVAPDDVSVVQPTSEPILTLLTCTRWDAQNRRYTERVVVIARLVEEEIPQGTRSRLSPED